VKRTGLRDLPGIVSPIIMEAKARITEAGVISAVSEVGGIGSRRELTTLFSVSQILDAVKTPAVE